MKKEVLGLALVAVIAALLTATASAQLCICEEGVSEAECCAREAIRDSIEEYLVALEANASVEFACIINPNLQGCPAVETTCRDLCIAAESVQDPVNSLITEFCGNCRGNTALTVDQYCRVGDGGTIPVEKELDCQILLSENYRFFVLNNDEDILSCEADLSDAECFARVDGVSVEELCFFEPFIQGCPTINEEDLYVCEKEEEESEAECIARAEDLSLEELCYIAPEIPGCPLTEAGDDLELLEKDFELEDGAAEEPATPGDCDPLLEECPEFEFPSDLEFVCGPDLSPAECQALQQGISLEALCFFEPTFLGCPLITDGDFELPPFITDEGEFSEARDDLELLEKDLEDIPLNITSLEDGAAEEVGTVEDGDSEASDGSDSEDDSDSDSDDSDGSDSDSDSEDDPGVCCQALTAECEACKAGVSVRKYCKKNPDTDGCPEPKEPEDPKEWKSYVHASTSGEAEADSRGKRRGHVVAESSESVRARKKRGQRYSVHALSDTNSTVTAKGENAKGKANARAKANVDDWWRSQADSKSETSAEVTIKDGEVDGKVSEHLDANSNGKYAWGEAKGKADAKGYGYIWKKNNVGPTPTEDKWKKPHKKWGRKRPSHKKWRKWGHKKNE